MLGSIPPSIQIVFPTLAVWMHASWTPSVNRVSGDIFLTFSSFVKLTQPLKDGQTNIGSVPQLVPTSFSTLNLPTEVVPGPLLPPPYQAHENNNTDTPSADVLLQVEDRHLLAHDPSLPQPPSLLAQAHGKI